VEAIDVHVARSLIDYRKPIRLDEMIHICVRIARVGRSSIVTRWEIHGGGGEDLRVEGEMVAVNVDLATGAPKPVPEDVVALFEAYEGRPLKESRA
jgi:acyl-CoA thioester hydrolase